MKTDKIRHVTLGKILENREFFPVWIIELAENHKSNWEPNSKGGEPNHD